MSRRGGAAKTAPAQKVERWSRLWFKLDIGKRALHAPVLLGLLDMTIIAEFAPAKINLTLNVLGRRPDGYHELQSLVAFARDAADVVTLDVTRPFGCEVVGPFGKTIAGQNLIDVTLAKLAAADPRLRLGYVVLTKNLPVAAGIGGGSADAAAVLRAVRRANPDRVPHVDWYAIAASLGADVPVCFENRAAWMTGIGEVVSAIPALPVLNSVLVNPLLAMPTDKTAQIFRNLNASPLQLSYKRAPPPEFQSETELLGYMAAHENTLERAACTVAPVISEILLLLRETPGCCYAAVSGSGPTCFGIFEDAELVADQLRSAKPNWWIKSSRLN